MKIYWYNYATSILAFVIALRDYSFGHPRLTLMWFVVCVVQAVVGMLAQNKPKVDTRQ